MPRLAGKGRPITKKGTRQTAQTENCGAGEPHKRRFPTKESWAGTRKEGWGRDGESRLSVVMTDWKRKSCRKKGEKEGNPGEDGGSRSGKKASE